MRSEPRLTSALLLDNALPSWTTTPNSRIGFLSLGFSVSASRILPLAILFPIKLINYILSVRLRFYPLNFWEEPPTSSMSKNLSFIIHQPNSASQSLRAYIPMPEGRGFTPDSVMAYF